MKLHIITVGAPKLAYAKLGWEAYLGRLRHYHTIRTTHLADKHAADTAAFQRAIGKAYAVALVIDDGRTFDSHTLARFLEQRAQQAREVCFIIGGPEGLPPEITAQCDMRWSLSPLTFPHDLAMVVLAEALYRASTITASHPYHKA